jgi:anthranilate/para-aminobenzoate synthase component II
MVKSPVLLSVMSKIEDWQALINKPVLSIDQKEIGVVSDVQPLHIIVSSGPVTPNKYNIPKKLISKFENGVVYLSSSQKDVSDNHEFE